MLSVSPYLSISHCLALQSFSPSLCLPVSASISASLSLQLQLSCVLLSHLVHLSLVLGLTPLPHGYLSLCVSRDPANLGRQPVLRALTDKLWALASLLRAGGSHRQMETGGGNRLWRTEWQSLTSGLWRTEWELAGIGVQKSKRQKPWAWLDWILCEGA